MNLASLVFPVNPVMLKSFYRSKESITSYNLSNMFLTMTRILSRYVSYNSSQPSKVFERYGWIHESLFLEVFPVSYKVPCAEEVYYAGEATHKNSRNFRKVSAFSFKKASIQYKNRCCDVNV